MSRPRPLSRGRRTTAAPSNSSTAATARRSSTPNQSPAAKKSERPSKRQPGRKHAVATAEARKWPMPRFADQAQAIAICEKVLKHREVGDRSRGVAKLIGLRPDEVIFWPEHFIIFFTLAALEAGIDVRAFGAKLDPKAGRPEFVPAAAFRTIAQVAGVYRENPGALTLFKVQRSFLTAMAAALIGIATGKVTEDPTLNGALGGIGGLLINILAQRYAEDGVTVGGGRATSTSADGVGGKYANL